MDFVCPKCGGELFELPGMKKCVGGHCFDRAKEGYYNLLLGVGGGVHGDNKMMLDARRRFLSSGAYGPLCDLLAKTVMGLLPRGGSVLDAGCGEGYYTDAVERAVRERDGESNVLALDISKEGVRIASKRNPTVSYAVASSYAMPVADGSVDVIMNVFSPMASDEVRRALKPDGSFVLVYPDRRHLWELKSVLYETPYENKPQDTAPEGFVRVGNERLGYEVTLIGEQIWDLFLMTPYAYRTGDRDREKLSALESLTVRIEFCIDTYKKAEEA